MIESEFLNKLKDALDKAELNSEAANKINEISALAEEKVKNLPDDINVMNSSISKSYEERIEKAGVKTVSEEEAAAINSRYEELMKKIKTGDMANQQLAVLTEIENTVKLSINDMMIFINELNEKFAKEFESENPLFAGLSLKIEEISSKYYSIIN